MSTCFFSTIDHRKKGRWWYGREVSAHYRALCGDGRGSESWQGGMKRLPDISWFQLQAEVRWAAPHPCTETGCICRSWDGKMERDVPQMGQQGSKGDSGIRWQRSEKFRHICYGRDIPYDFNNMIENRLFSDETRELFRKSIIRWQYGNADENKNIIITTWSRGSDTELPDFLLPELPGT